MFTSRKCHVAMLHMNCFFKHVLTLACGALLSPVRVGGEAASTSHCGILCTTISPGGHFKPRLEIRAHDINGRE